MPLSRYLEPEDADAFVDYPEREQPQYEWTKNRTVKCPKCLGHGGWNLRLNSYKMPAGKVDTAENRHKYRHFRAHCVQCSGYGWVKPEEAVCVHDYSKQVTVGNCLHEWTCVKCGKTIQVDSSD